MEISLPSWSEWDQEVAVPEGLTLIDTHSVEPVGFWFYFSGALEKALNNGTVAGVEAEASKGGPSNEGDESPTNARYTGKQKYVKLTDEELQVDWYEMIGLPDGEGASENEIRAAYKRRCLETHPDKQPNHSDVLFKKVQRAFEILGCPDARRAFDSSRPFDDSIPLDMDHLGGDDSRFYTLFNPVFQRNKKWSCNPKIPSLGDESTPIAAVRQFYDEWHAFRTWRDFSHEASDLEEIDEGMCREEKRFYMRENQRILEKHKKDELKRVRTLVERAMKLDPRLRRQREEIAAAKEKERAEREAEKERVRAEAEAKLVARIAKEREEAEAKKAAKDNEKQRLIDLKERVIVRFEDSDLLDDIETNKLLPDLVRLPNIDWLLSVVKNVDEIEAIADRLYATDDVEVVGVFNEIVEERELIVGMSRYGEPCRRLDAEAIAKRQQEVAKAREEARIRAAGIVWTDEDLSNLSKAIAKYPGGTMDRWRKIAQMLHDKYTEDEVLTKTKTLEAALKKSAGGMAATTSAAQHAGNASSVRPSQSAPTAATDVEEWSEEQQKALEHGLRELKDYKQKDKYQRIANKVEGKNAKQCFERYKYLCSINKKK